MKSNSRPTVGGGTAEVAALVAVAVGDRRLVLHAQVRALDQLEAVAVERVLAEVLLEGGEHRLRLLEVASGLLQVPGQDVVVEGQRLAVGVHVTVAEVGELADVDRDVVIIDRIADPPDESGPAVVQGGPLDESAVGDVLEAGRDGDGEGHRLRLVGRVVLVGPPEARAGPLGGDGDPGVAARVLGPGEAAVPGGPPRDPGLAPVGDGQAVAIPRAERLGERDEDRVLLAAVRGGPVVVVERDPLDLHVGEEVDLEDLAVGDHVEDDGVAAADRACVGVDPHVEVVRDHVVAGALGAEGAAEDLVAGRLLLLGDGVGGGDRRGDREGERRGRRPGRVGPHPRFLVGVVRRLRRLA